MNEPVTARRIRSSDVRCQCATHKQREPCFICGKHRSITEAHHTIPLKNMALLLEAWESLPEPPIVWLCPNCHTYVHIWQRADPSDMEPGMLEKIFEIKRIGDDSLGQYAEATIAQLKQDGGGQSD